MRIRESEILRGEVLLHDVEPFMEGINVAIEQLISLVYLNFMEGIKAEGTLPVYRSRLLLILSNVMEGIHLELMNNGGRTAKHA